MKAIRTFRAMASSRSANERSAFGNFATWPVSAITLEIVPGPLNKGMASGMMAISSRWAPSASSSGVWRTRAGFASIMSKAIFSRRSPATMRNASMVTPKNLKMKLPKAAKSTNTTKTTRTARLTIAARSASELCGVMDRKMGTLPTASSVTKRDTNAVTKNVSSASISGQAPWPC